ncbi:MAG: hydrogenase nickel incorporation protein HypB [Bacteroidales bacterium]|nr:hydrogenase nickel incorporation protein HypB [Bacteroidales bacterium]
MCSTCGCGGNQDDTKIYRPGENKYSSFVFDQIHHVHAHSHDHVHVHTHAHEHPHPHDHDHTHEHSVAGHISLEQEILTANNRLAERNRGFFEARNIFAINLVSSPGAGKTSLLEHTLRELGASHKCYVIEGDQQTDNDARRIQQTGVDVIQVNTGNGCHLDANMVHQAIHQLNPAENSLLFIENVGNLVCPSLFDLGENFRVVIFSVTEGEDKPLKYPNIFHSSQLVIINKIDLLPYLEFDVEKAKTYVQRISPQAKILELSVKNRSGIDQWINWLIARGK